MALGGLQAKPELNGSHAIVMEWHGASRRWAVEMLRTGERLRVCSSNLTAAPVAASEGAREGGYAEEYVWLQTQE